MFLDTQMKELGMEPKQLDQVILMKNQKAQSATASIGVSSIDLDSTTRRKGISHVDTNKLAKAEAKIEEKRIKRDRKVNYEASKLINKIDNNELEILQVNPIMDYTLNRGKSKDIKVENFDISFAGKRILTDASITLAYGRRYGLIGRNGIGKSTLLRYISKRELNIPTHISILHVEQEMAGDDTPALRSVLKADIWREHLLAEEEEGTKRIQEIEAIDASTLTPEEVKAYAAEKDEINSKLKDVYTKLEEIESDKAESRAASILSGLGFSQDRLHNATKTFSGGWRMRLSLARALFCKPDLLLLDEPTNMLDIPAVMWLENYLETWPSTLFVVSHDREFLDSVATDIIHHHSERLDHYKGNFTNFYATREERRKTQLKEYESQMEQRKHLQSFIDRWRYNANRAAQAQMKIKILEKMPELEKPEDENVVTFRFPDPDSISPPILQMSGVDFGYNPDKLELKNVDLDLQLDSRIAVVGPNGAGKSTMLKLLTGKLEPKIGMVHRHGRLRFAMFTQHHVDQLDLDMSPVGYMASKWPGKLEEDYRRQLGAFGITGMVGLQPIRTLSGGQKSRVAFACMGLLNPHILVLDEPTNHLDMESMDALTKAIQNFEGGVVVVSHDERFINSVATHLWICDNQTVTKFQGNIKDYKNKLIAEQGL
ncbi:P-loop containing nucleoside triphosphate hydrolase protein [Conidiobolus coronatus NRRL 28638]|uniref:p-loop containing nucleoside triphosphate hydrolase protein n=1 Tax=Conidiobolus coronatus (strain ATCC 28846 / CBS 209.66 / NRRL 28638) TaxID=796925 RepID=A0A137NWW6_CONC2|nr:P-loop containing nucleoside triphosphate hydrolase protein [Conidiobolus coronatus NRRL 28638]|eukprot:KXN67246.1 P-loop containing nucleoside triphosphate hydrolase protein [Conidiobolus coronatus NRRL 28638]